MIRNAVVNLRRGSLKPVTSAVLFVRPRSTASAAAESDLLGVRPYEEIPGPKPLPLIGNTWRFLPYIGEFGNKDFNGIIEGFRKYGKMVRISGLHAHPDMIFLYEPKDVEMLFRNEGHWPVRSGVNSLPYYRAVVRKDLYKGNDGVFFTQGKQWHDFRTKVNQTMMQPRNCKLYVGPIETVTNELLNRMRSLMNEKGELPSDFNEYLMRWALESISLIALDTRLGCLDPDLSPDSETEKMIRAVHYVPHAIFQLDVNVSPRHFTKRKEWKKLVEVSDFANEVTLKYVRKAMDRIKTKVDRGDSDMSVLETLLIKNEDPMIATVMALDMMLAGIDTTSNASATALYYLATNQDKQEKLFRELETILPSKDDPITSSKLEEMKYLRACMRESMRISPTVSGTSRETQKDMVLGNYLVPKGVYVYVASKYMSNEEENFPEPDRFIPERWLKGSEQEQKANPFISLPFGFGPRMCLGRRFAELEVETLLAKVIRNFRLEYQGELTTRATIINVVENPLTFKLEERS